MISSVYRFFNHAVSARIAGFLPRLALLLLAFVGVRPALAHDEGFSGLIIILESNAVKLEASIHTRDLTEWFPPSEEPGYTDSLIKLFEQQAAKLYDVQLSYSTADLGSAKAHSPEPGLIQIDLRYPYEGDLQSVKVEFLHFDKLPRAHRQWIVMEDRRNLPAGAKPPRLLEDTIWSTIPMSAKDIPSPAWPTPATPASTGPSTQAVDAGTPTAVPAPNYPATESRINFFVDGLKHILFGADHLLFIAALLLACRTFREAATIVTFFTVAHSVTLALSAMKLVNISPDIIEPAIAATIVFVAVENLLHRPKLAWRCGITLFFGLIHGLGFAKDLRERLASDSFSDILWPLVKFSAGVEAGHLALVALALPLLLAAKRRTPSFDRVAVPALSLVISVFGGFWLITRVWGVMHGEG